MESVKPILCGAAPHHDDDRNCLHGECLDPNGEWKCGTAEKCERDCQAKENDPQTCEESGGTFFDGRCCPAEGFVVDGYGGHRECKYFPAGTPEGHTIQHPTCCEA